MGSALSGSRTRRRREIFCRRLEEKDINGLMEALQRSAPAYMVTATGRIF